MENIQRKITVTEFLQLLDDPQLHEETLREFLVVDNKTSDAFAPVLTFNPETVDVEELASGVRPRGSTFLKLFNNWARQKRQKRFHKQILNGYQGPIIVSEGDSWFQYPIMLDDVIDCLSGKFAVFSLGAAADTLQGMLRQDEFINAIHDVNADIFLLSGGGNDLFGQRRLSSYVREFDPTLQPDQYLLPAFDGFLNDVMALYQQLIQRVRTDAPHVQVLCHAYDLAIPDGQQWLGKPLAARGIVDKQIQKRIVAQVFGRFSDALQILIKRHENVHFVDISGAVKNRWTDELHPSNAGFKDVSSVFVTAVDELTTNGVIDIARSVAHTASEIVRATAATATSSVQSAATADATPVTEFSIDSSQARTRMTAPTLLQRVARGYSLHIGVNTIDPEHYGWDGELLACEADADAMLDIAESTGYHESTSLLTRGATRQSVTDSIQSISAKMTASDIFFISYAGHGGQLKDLNEDEDDGADETWCLYDSQMIDDELYDLWQGFPAGSRVLIVSDSCHSGSVARAGIANHLPSPAEQNKPRARVLPARLAARIYRKNRAFYDSRLQRAGKKEATGDLPVSVRLLSGCQDNQLSMDGAFNGAFTTQLLKVWSRGKYHKPYKNFMREIRMQMPETQTPNHYVAGVPDALFDSQWPFTI
ncbi:MAG: caspase family protein [Granulosicoccus sp.]